NKRENTPAPQQERCDIPTPLPAPGKGRAPERKTLTRSQKGGGAEKKRKRKTTLYNKRGEKNTKNLEKNGKKKTAMNY
ncbi:hypothetical protein Q8G24_27405, partial [Klebsiella pneumoniae]|nr:hypothetical protein [Klebsiella pneumoniae]